LLKKLYLNRELDEWYKEKCLSNFIMPKDLEGVERIKKIEVRNRYSPSTEIYISLNDFSSEGFILKQKIQIRASKILPVYEAVYLHAIKHPSLFSGLDLWGPPQTTDLMEVAELIEDSFARIGYQELSGYDLRDTVFEWHELKGIEEVNRRLILEDAIFVDLLDLCE
jgi:hypothetical protein